MQFPFGTFRPEKQDYLFRRSVAPGNFPLERPEKSCTIYFPDRNFRKVFVNGKQPVFLQFNFLVLTLKSHCYFVYDISAIVHMPLSCNVLECFTARFVPVGA